LGSKPAAVLAIFAGMLLIVGNVAGSTGLVGMALGFLIGNLSGPVSVVLAVVLTVLEYIASLGGVAVIIGGILIYRGRRWLGTFVIMLGSGMGLIGFLLIVASVAIQGLSQAFAFVLLVSQSIGWIGLILALVSTLLAR
jgi:hypothetical protein